jgi:hypothetical protein
MKTFRIIISVLFSLLVLAIISNLLISTLGLFFNIDVLFTGNYFNQSPSLNIKLIFVFKAIALLAFVFGVFVLISKINIVVKRDFFNHKLISCFETSGKLFLSAGILGIITSISEIINQVLLNDYSHQVYLNIDSKGLYIMLMILGLFFILFSKVLDRGRMIQTENDLTI